MKSTFKRSQFAQLICSLSGAILLLSSVAHAQVDFREPFRDVMSFQRAGINDAVGEVACEHGQPQLQNAVLLEDPATRPQYIYGDDGSKTCIAGSCLKKAETGQAYKRCESKRTDVKWFGERDVRNDADAYVTSTKDKAAYSGVGKIECVGNKKVVDPVTKKISLKRGMFYVTAFHAGSFDTVVTNAHAFVEDRINPSTKTIEEVKLDPSNCSAVFFDLSGNPERIPLAYVNSRWDKPGLFGDKSHDIAIVKLAKESTVPSAAPPYQFGYGNERVEGLPVTIVGFHNDVMDSNKIRKTRGVVFSAQDGFQHQVRAARAETSFTNIKNVFVGDYPSNHGSSGSPIFSSEGKVIGIHQGQFDQVDPSTGKTIRKFDRNTNYNMGIFFDEQFHQDLQRMKAYKSNT